MDVRSEVLRACAAHFREACALLDEDLDPSAFVSGYVAYELWKSESRMSQVALPIAS